MDPTIPVIITHSSGLQFNVNLTEAEFNRCQTDESFNNELCNKYFELHRDGLVSAINDEDYGQPAESEPQLGTSHEGGRPGQWSSDYEETLIRLVSERPPLFDFRIPLKERGRATVKNLWEKILLNLNVDMTVEEITKKWKNIRDSFIRVRANIKKKLASGSSAKEKFNADKLKRNHKHYDLLLFLEDSLTIRRTSSNLQDPTVDTEATEDSLRFPLASPVESTPSTSRSESRLQEVSSDEKFLQAIRELPQPKQFTGTENFCLRLAEGLSKLPPRINNQLQLEFVSRLIEMENKYIYN